jgi:membrane-associated phospholipid phosphatase
MAALASTGVTMLVARHLRFDEPPLLDTRMRALVRAHVPPRAKSLLAPLFPIGLPGGYITAAYATAHWLHARQRSGGPAIVTSAWLGWLVHRAAKLVYLRERPRRRNVRRRTDSYPSGHTTGMTSLAVTAACVLRRNRLVSGGTAVGIAVGAPALMGAYRVIADDHWTTDVIGGWLLGAAIGMTCNALLADAIGGRAHDVRAVGACRPALFRRGHRARATSGEESGRSDSRDGRERIARSSAR